MRHNLRLLLGSGMLMASYAIAQGEFQEWTFNPLTVKRDPFMAPAKFTKVIENELFRYDLSNLKLVAIASGIENPRAMFQVKDESNSQTFVLTVGDRLGRRKGKVVSILENLVVVKTTFVDNNNKSLPVTTKFRIDE